MPYQIFIFWIINISHLKHDIIINNIILSFIEFKWIFFAILPTKLNGQNHIFIMNRCKIRLSDKTHSKTLKKYSYFSIKNLILIFFSVFAYNFNTCGWNLSKFFKKKKNMKCNYILMRNRNEIPKLTKYFFFILHRTRWKSNWSRGKLKKIE